MEYRRQIRGFLASRVIFMVVVICVHPDSTNGRSVVVLKEPSGEFQSPGYPDLDDHTDCTWKIFVPPHHKITITFLDFDLVERPICNDEVEIHDENVKRGPYWGKQLLQESFTSTSSTISVVLTSCWTSLLTDRRGIRVSYSTVYPTTPTHETSERVNTTRRVTPSSLGLTELHTGLPPSDNNSSKQGSGKLLIGAMLAGLLSIAIIIIIVFLIVKRTKGFSFNAKIEDRKAKHEQDDLSTAVNEGTGEDNCQLEYDYVQGDELQNAINFNVSMDKNGHGRVATKFSFSRLQKKHPVFNTSNDLCDNNVSNVYDNTDLYKDYSTTSCSTQQASPKVESNDNQIKTKTEDINLNEGIVINTAYEPYLSHT